MFAAVYRTRFLYLRHGIHASAEYTGGARFSVSCPAVSPVSVLHYEDRIDIDGFSFFRSTVHNDQSDSRKGSV